MLARGSFGFPHSAAGGDDWNGRNPDDGSGSEGPPPPVAGPSGTKPKRKRPKFIRKVECQVCGDVANDHIHYGAIACYSCRAFFRRGVNSGSPYCCSREKKCLINKQTRKHCRYCRFEKCLKVGMKRTWVMSEEDKKVKREKALLRKLSMENRKAQGRNGKKGGPSNAPPLAVPPRLVEIAEPEPDRSFSGQHSRLPIAPPIVVQPQRKSPRPALMSPKRGPASPSASSSHVVYVRDEPMSPGTLQLHSLSISEFNQPMTHESGYSSSGRSPGNLLEDRPSSPEDEDRHYGADEHYSARGAIAATAPPPARAMEELEMIDNPDLGRDMVPINQPVVPFTVEESLLIDNLVRIELGTAELIPVPMNVMHSFIHAARTGTAVPYQATLEGYTVCMERIIKYASQLDFFRSFSSDDQRNLLLANTDVLVNIKSARMLRPGVNLQDQLAFAVGTSQVAVEHMAPFGGYVNPHSAGVDYKQIYQSPWASSADHEMKFRNMMKSIFDLKMDRTTTTLMGMMALFSVSHAELQERDRAMQNQEFFSQLLYRYLCSAIGENNAIQLLPRYMYLLSELEEMAQIMVTKRLLL